MFTGIVTDIGEITCLKPTAQGCRGHESSTETAGAGIGDRRTPIRARYSAGLQQSAGLKATINMGRADVNRPRAADDFAHLRARM